jgi:predicted ATPase/DNA-binding CsgD family transcriptional regulator
MVQSASHGARGTHPDNLPARRDPLIGREAELAAARALLLREDVGLLTLTGPGGVGKTRLAAELATALGGAFRDGVCFVGLDPVRDRRGAPAPDLVAVAIARTLGVRETAGRTALDSLRESLRHRHLLLLLDSFEPLLPAAPLVADLLTACPRLKLLVTSRAVLRLSQEHDLPVPPLRVPDGDPRPPLEDLAACPAVRLFVARAQAVTPAFNLTDDCAEAVAAICRRLDGLPLAIELAAARTRLLPPRALLARLEGEGDASPLRVLTGGPRDLATRQQTLRDTIAWSHDLLNPTEQALFRRLALFVGGWTLEAAEAVCAPSAPRAVLDLLASLVDQSLIYRTEQGDDAWFGMLETIREFGLERLQASGEAEELRRRHAAYYLTLAVEADSDLRGPDPRRALARLEAAHGNLRTALRRAIEHGEATLALRLAAALWWFWHLRGDWREGRGWLEQALGLAAGAAPTPARAEALLGAGVLARRDGDLPSAQRRFEESVAHWRAVGHRGGLAYALAHVGVLRAERGDPGAGLALAKESATVLREVGDTWRLTLPLGFLARAAMQHEEYATARRLLEENVAACRIQGDSFGLAQWLSDLGDVARYAGDDNRAMPLYQESLELFRTLGARAGIASLLHNLGYLAAHRRDGRQAMALFRESAQLFRALGDRQGLAECLVGLASVAVGAGEAGRAARLFAAAEAQLQALGTTVWPSNRADYERIRARLRASLDDAALAAARTEGRALPFEQALEEALAATGPGPPPHERGPLSAREREVAALLARGLTNRQIADELVVARSTVDRHVVNILRKLGLANRTRVATWATEHGLRAEASSAESANL